MSSDKTGGWFSSVVGNISGLWSRSSLEPIPEHETASRIQQRSRLRGHLLDTSLEEQDDIDALDGDDDMDDGIVIQECTSTAIDNATTSKNEPDDKKKKLRYLSPRLLRLAAKAEKAESSGNSASSASRKRRAVSPLHNFTLSSLPSREESLLNSNRESLLFGCSTEKRSRVNDYMDDRPMTSLFRSPSVDLVRENSFASWSSPVSRRFSTHPSSAASSLSCKTRAILQQLEQIVNPSMNLKGSTSFEPSPERWSKDAFSSYGTPPRKSLGVLSRAQLISSKLTPRSKNMYWEHPAHGNVRKTKSPLKFYGDVEKPKEKSKMHEDLNVMREKHPSPTSIEGSIQKAEGSTRKISSDAANDECMRSPKAEHTSASKSSSVGVLSIAKDDDPAAATEKKVPSNEVTGDKPQEMIQSFSARTSTFSANLPELGIEKLEKEKKEEKQESEVEYLFALPKKRLPSTNKTPEKSDGMKPQEVISGDKPLKSLTTLFPVQTPKKASLEQKESAQEATDTAAKKEVTTLLQSFAVVKNAETKKSETAAEKTTKKDQITTWCCPACMVYNKKEDTKCICCFYEKKPWTCAECWVSNKADVEKCVACGATKTADIKQKVTSEDTKTTDSGSVFGSRTFKPVTSASASAFTFGTSKQSINTLPTSQEQEVTTCTVTSSVTASTATPLATVNGGVSTAGGVMFGLSNSASVPILSKPSEPVPTIPSKTEESVVSEMPSSSATEATTSSVTSPVNTSSTTLLQFPTLTQSSFSTPNLISTSVASSATSEPLKSTFNFPISTTGGNFFFGATAKETTQTSNASIVPTLSFGSKFPALSTPATTTVPAPTTTTSFINAPVISASLFGSSHNSAQPFSALSKAPIFGTNGPPTSPQNSDAIEMGSPTISPQTATTTVFPSLPMVTAPLFTFGASVKPSTSTVETSSIFGSQPLQQQSTAQPQAPLFSFGQKPNGSSEVFSTSVAVNSPPATFNFGGTANGSSGFVFGSTAPPTSFTFGAQPTAGTASTPFSFEPAAPAPAFGAAPSAPNFFSVGSTSTTATTARKMLKARRMRK